MVRVYGVRPGSGARPPEEAVLRIANAGSGDARSDQHARGQEAADRLTGGGVEEVQPGGVDRELKRGADGGDGACPTGGASTVKIAWISVPSRSVTPAVTAIFGQAASANEASSKSEGLVM
jgi:hypothetical protein